MIKLEINNSSLILYKTFYTKNPTFFNIEWRVVVTVVTAPGGHGS